MHLFPLIGILAPDIPGIIEQAQKGPLGILALLIIVIEVLALQLFKKSQLRVRVGIFVAIFLGSVIAGAVLIREYEIQQGLRGGKIDPGPAEIQAPDLEAHSWRVIVTAKGYPVLKGNATFEPNHDFRAPGTFLVPTAGVGQHLDCPGELGGTWRYSDDARGAVSMELHLNRILHDNPQCASWLPSPTSAPSPVSTVCKFTSSTRCEGSGIEMRLF